jgi:glycine/D-amino acid oxidase-like deaminating enzyme/nitrite reductase/ring-hydroxylating ferredoxin subunit
MGPEMAQIYADANESAIQWIKGLIAEKGIHCDLEERSAYIYTQSDQNVQKIAAEAETAASLGIRAFYLDEIPLPFPVKAALRFDGQAQFHPRKYLLPLSEDIPGEGCHIFEQTRAVEIREGDPVIIRTASGAEVRADKVIVASHYPFHDKPGLYFARIHLERSYVLGITIKEKFPEGMYITAEGPGRSLRAQNYEDGEMILVGGESHKTGHGKSTLEHYANLYAFAEEIFTVKKHLYRWSTHDCVTLDQVPYIGQLGPTAPNIYVATGFRKWGMTQSTVSALILKELLFKGEHPWLPLYNPSRFTLSASAVSLIKENTDVAVNFAAGKIVPGANLEEVEPNRGLVVSVDGRRAGAYRDARGDLHCVDTTCTHMRCELNWNDAETTWDCPCHGSRFTVDGDIVEGPAVTPLNKLK